VQFASIGGPHRGHQSSAWREKQNARHNAGHENQYRGDASRTIDPRQVNGRSVFSASSRWLKFHVNKPGVRVFLAKRQQRIA
jgi:hypothetical protein